MVKCIKVRTLVLAFGLASSLQVLSSTPYYRIRSQSTDSGRDMMGIEHLINNPDEDAHLFAITPQYNQSYDSDNIAFGLFGKNCLKNCKCPTLKISGSQAANRGQKDWLADYFGLPTDFESTITFKPKIQNYLVDFYYRYSFDNSCHKGLYFSVQAPVVYTKWNLNYCETVNNSGQADYSAFYFTQAAVPRFRLLDSFSDYITNGNVPDINSSSTAALLDFAPLAYSRWASQCDVLKETKLSDIQVVLGKNFKECSDYHAGLNLRASVPTGNRPKGEYLFEPIVGNSHHWEFGLGLSAHHTFWKNEDCSQTVGWYIDANITHLFADRQVRVFDLKNRCNSRYMLAEFLNQPVSNLQQFGSTPAIIPAAQFQFSYTPVANLTKSIVNVSVPIQVDLSVIVNFTRCNWNIDWGYNFWYRSPEKLHFNAADNCQHALVNNHNWALKGDALMYGTALGQFVPLSASQSQATIHQGTNNYPTGINGQSPLANPGVDNPQLAANASGFQLFNGAPFPFAAFMNSSFDPIFLSFNDMDISGARTKGLTHKLFSHYSYTWQEDACGRIPFLGFGYSIEFGNNHSGTNVATQTTCTSFSCVPCDAQNARANSCSLSQWGVWLKGGCTFN